MKLSLKRRELSPWQAPIALIAVLTGLLIAIDLRIHDQLTNGPNTKRAETLAAMASRLEKENKAIEKEVSSLRQQLAEWEASQKAEGSLTLQAIRAQMDLTRALVGLTPVEGPGVVIVVNDRTEALELARKENQQVDYWDYLVHDSDLVYLVNDLRAGGAEAIAVNGERIISSSDIKCGGFIVFTNSNRLTAPYQIKAIGDPVALKRAVERGFTYSVLKSLDYPIRIEQHQKILVPAYSGALALRYGQPLTPPAEKGS
ncbi:MULTISPECIES: DUF881 domain-containing protein [Carboxydocella]|uniref:Uncharacterized conserved protein YlxW, UPF0749 family n=2 Tax=Carboxydocella TaxID=178898 RepID=A0A1T4NZL3_9FIRM|nr:MULTISPECIES: DUF881 domain-containing protein [Carboxydocella]AVX19612.1 Uncharacterized conserved protein YlxW, UPF0749 family [Carboxydocella thermautotrophica]AVX30027.1 Uncharacterized conserved protein YlxW, UPF0749 family [Carboxydocella thermautotrophica]SJZ84665.1 Uncharacterized conserved protein YlxW, UPF0749 family [Carboxydocella sporoproducens DSM 16521]GAW29499.1 hypothetical protein ULO1_20690 [Carboxydocella sp. ULO1]GAW31274.1 hypothetical protein JDF658_10390 [Carboxydoce